MDVSKFIEMMYEIDKEINHIVEDDSILRIYGEDYNEKISKLYDEITSISLDIPNVELIYDPNDIQLLINEEISDKDNFNKKYSWKFTLDKNNILTKKKEFEYVFYYSKSEFYNKIKKENIFTALNGFFDKEKRVFIVNSLKKSFGGGNFWVLSPSHEIESDNEISLLPSSESVHKLIHTNSIEAVRVCPRALSLEWGDYNNDENYIIRRNSAKVLASCLVQELIVKPDTQKVTIKGNKKVTVNLSNDNEDIDCGLLDLLNETVRWVYEERSETRLQLIMDRLSLDISEEKSYLYSLSLFLKKSLEQAKDSYTFVILERKDNYYKEVRELIKDMKEQADLYATKTRNLINSITRDLLGVLVFFSFSFLSRIQKIDIETLLSSKGFPLVSKVLSVYLLLSFFLQLVVHLRDDKLTNKENERWLDILQNYSNSEDKKKNFLTPIKERRYTFFVALKVFTLIYLVSIVSVWNLSEIIIFLLKGEFVIINEIDISSFKIYYEKFMKL